MAPALLTRFRVLVVPGLHGSEKAHWQSRWQQLFPSFERVVQNDWHEPDLRTWSARVDAVRFQPHDGRPQLIVAHSFGVLASVHSVARDPGLVAGMLLVAPAEPEKFGLSCMLPRTRLPCPSTVVASTNDPWMTDESALRWAARWESDALVAGALGHINAESGLGDWPAGLEQLQRLAERAHNGRSDSINFFGGFYGTSPRRYRARL